MASLPSIRRRLTLSLLAVSLAGAAAVAAGVVAVVRHEVEEIMDATLAEAAEVLHNTLAWARPMATRAGAASTTLPAPEHEEHVVWQMLDAQGRVVLHSHRAPATPLLSGLRQGFADVRPDWRVHAVPLSFEPGTLLVAQPQVERDEAVFETSALAAGLAFAIGLVSALWLGLNVRRELRPLDRLSQAVARFDPTDDGSRLPMVERAELAPMQAAIEQLGSRLSRRLRQERAFAAHAAHALRTPLAGLVVQMKVAEHHSAPEGRAALAHARSAADRLGRVVTALLALFRSGHELQREAVDLRALVRELPSAGLTVRVRTDVQVHADADLLAAALANLIDNASRHGARQLDIEVQAHAHAETVSIVLQDDGPGIDEALRGELQTELDRGNDPSRSGLGLKLADGVARAHGGRLQLLASAAGCRIALTLAAA